MTHFDITRHVNTFLPQSTTRNDPAAAPTFKTLDGSDVAAWLRSNGYVVTGYQDTGRNGLAVTKCGYAVSTNGYVCRASELSLGLRGSDIMPNTVQAKALSDLWKIGQIATVIEKVKANIALHSLVYMNLQEFSDIDAKMFLSNTSK